MGHLIAVEPLRQSSPFPEPQRFKHEKINYSLIKYWMHYCNNTHSERCKPDKFTLPESFKVIDCRKHEDLKVISAPADCKYAALSYVWGNIENLGPDDGKKFPQVVMDSIKVVQELDCDYLWVDRHVSLIDTK